MYHKHGSTCDQTYPLTSRPSLSFLKQVSPTSFRPQIVSHTGDPLYQVVPINPKYYWELHESLWFEFSLGVGQEKFTESLWRFWECSGWSYILQTSSSPLYNRYPTNLPPLLYDSTRTQMGLVFDEPHIWIYIYLEGPYGNYGLLPI